MNVFNNVTINNELIFFERCSLINETGVQSTIYDALILS